MASEAGTGTTNAPIEGGCHCGNVRLRIDWPADAPDIPARACSCSFCVKHGGVWTAHPAAALRATVGAAGLHAYRFGTGTATFHLCPRCAVVPFVTCTIDDVVHAVVNVNTFENVDPARLRRATVSFEGEDLAGRLARRKRNWIAHVEVREAVGMPARST
jgi:hypothetical protein